MVSTKTRTRLWTHQSLLRAALCEVMRPDTPVKLRSLNPKHELAFCWQEERSGKVKEIVMDPYLCGLVQSAIHEALHGVLFDDLMPFSRKLENQILTCLDNELFSYLRKHPAEMLRWREVIQRKAEEDRDRVEEAR